MQWIYLPQSPHLKSPEAGSLNVCLLIPVLKSNVGRSDDVQILNCLNISRPTGEDYKESLTDCRTWWWMWPPDDWQSKLCEAHHSTAWGRPSSWCRNRLFLPQTTAWLWGSNTKILHIAINFETATDKYPSKCCEHNMKSCKRNYNTDESKASTETKFVG